MAKTALTPSIDRRSFVKLVTTCLGSIMALAVGLPGIGYLISPALKSQTTDAWIRLGPLENYSLSVPTRFNFTQARQNGWEKTVSSFGVYVWRKDQETVKVFSNICTHLGCRVSWHPDLQHYVSPCHDGHFDNEGQVVKGPPPRPLDQYEVKIDQGMLMIRIIE
ncbi:MAG TPA: ubiquinol-cytochrome c reductase iron-sulfur subunit [Anaerolineales bacterium]|nr:ubiquinol-cytochrome c reductase iron-sulfur subunit [Anaerolineales bacterium]